ncbi:MAG: hypothetical protein Q8P92_01170 [Candidatus Daviesbacteria bacterium]|nr:hypothetical protein [Candidatus Daviesbacteria bacterium]
MTLEAIKDVGNYTEPRVPKNSPLGHQHNEVVTYTNPRNGFTATFQWNGINEVYSPYKVLYNQSVDKLP